MIPLKLHYCWFGENEPPELVKKCLASWKRVMPDAQIMRWDESNVPINEHKFMKEAYKAKKYAFVSDYARYMILYNEGGIFLDCDVELIKPFDEILFQEDLHFFVGFEKMVKKNLFYVNPGLVMGSISNNEMLKDVIYIYDNIQLEIGTTFPYLKYTSPCVLTEYLVKKKRLIRNNQNQILDGGVYIYSSYYFSPTNPRYFGDKRIEICENTNSIHHGAASWMSFGMRFKTVISIVLHRILDK